MMIKHFNSEVIFFGQDWEEITSHRLKYLRKTKNCLCKLSTAKTTWKQSDHVHEILFPVMPLQDLTYYWKSVVKHSNFNSKFTILMCYS